ncbi:ribosomal protein L7/L12 [Clostridium estertheticum]|uniref:ribosomal protein L7/L12 n=1 Tax=Clostridium estertheticum TaxID=238834 RepID=UPI001C7D210D|nr:ribosomal protein L7/L12 [Clostridium estertheticum]MBX4265064.1 ribosomal protein L7/L12 [Clostridium estertheticum]MBX4268546.1 ribosomal protein L7/L12 [Clostridium estertheticum]WLC81394.1 ribosomal protein L7/L12 [Clostridium estertheticum]WLC88527.1 ribosomal protein L7/L12 [Clostridium estertheticum]
MNNIVIWGIIGAGLLIIIVCAIIRTQKDIERINVTLNKIAKHVGVQDTVTNELKSLILDGKKIEAIKKYRMVTGLGLLEAKEYVDSLCEKELK